MAAARTSGGESSGLIYTPVDRTKEAKKGGVLKTALGEETTTWDPSQSGAQFRGELFSTMLSAKSAIGKAPVGEYTGEIMEKWEVAPDGLTMTFTMRPNAHFAPLPPTNGRRVDIEDIKQSWDYYLKVGNRRADVFNSISPGAPVVSYSTPDSKTFVLKLAAPDVSIYDYLSSSSYPVVLTKEAINGVFDLRSTPIGSGPMYVKDHEPSSRSVLEKNPGYHLPGPHIQTYEQYYIKEYATLRSQLRAGNIHLLDEQDVQPTDLLPLKREVPDLLMVKEDVAADQGQQFFGYKDDPLAIFRDERVRQALSMSYDRDLWIDTFYNVKNFENEGLPVATKWSLGGIPANVQGRWLLDAQNKIKGQEMGDAAKYFAYNPAEAKKLLAAAGFPNGADSESHHIITADYGGNHPKMIEVLLSMAQEAGFRIKIVPENYATSYRNNYRDVKGAFAGTSFVRVSLNNEADPTNRFYAQYHSTGDLFKGFDVNGRVAGAGDPVLDDLVVKMRREFDLDKRIAISHEVQRRDAAEAVLHPLPRWLRDLLAGLAGGWQLRRLQGRHCLVDLLHGRHQGTAQEDLARLVGTPVPFDTVRRASPNRRSAVFQCPSTGC